MTKTRLDEIATFKHIPLHNYRVLFIAIDECVEEIDRLNRLVEQLRRVHHEYVQAMIERDLNT